MAFIKASKREAKLRMALVGPSGSGKTYTALTLARELAAGGTIAVVDTEHGSASKYADLFDFDVLELETFEAEQYISALQDAATAGYAVVVLDSMSHAWNGKHGFLERVEAIGKRKGGNTYAAWGEIKPVENKLIEAIIGSPLHVIATMRAKTEHVQEKDERTGKTIIRKVGMAPIQRDGIEYEFDVYCDLTQANEMIVQKTRCPALAEAIIPKPGKQVADILKTWLHGAPAPLTLANAPAVPEPTPLRATSPLPPITDETRLVLTPHMLKDRASKRGITGAAWGALWAQHRGNLDAINASLDTLPREPEPDPDDDGGESAPAPIAATAEDNAESPEAQFDGNPAQAINRLHRRMQDLGMSVAQQEAFLARHSNATDADLAARALTWQQIHRVDRALTTYAARRIAKASQVPDLSTLPMAARGA